MHDSPMERLRTLGLELPPPPNPIGTFRTFRVAGPLLFLSGQGPRLPDGSLLTGVVGADLDVETAYLHARQVGLNLLSLARQALGRLDLVLSVVKVLGFVNAAPNFTNHPAVIDGCSDLFIQVLGAAGEHARSAIGAASLPGGISVEIEAILLVEGLGPKSCNQRGSTPSHPS